MDTSSIPRAKFVRSPTCGTFVGERIREEVLLELGWEQVPNLECMFVHRTQRLFLSVYVDGIKVRGRKQNMAPMWKKLMTLVDLGEPASFLDSVYLGCTQRECKPNETTGWPVFTA